MSSSGEDADLVERDTGAEGEAAQASGEKPVRPADSAAADVRPPGQREFGWRGWVLVGALVVALIVIPWTMIYLPQAQGFLESLGLGLRDAYLVLPLVPAFGLGAIAVWVAVASRRP